MNARPLIFRPLPPTHRNNGAHEKRKDHAKKATVTTEPQHPPSGEVLCRPARHLYVLHNEAQREKTGSPVKIVKPGRPVNKTVKKGPVRLCKGGLAMIKEEAKATAAEVLNKKKRKTTKVETCKEDHGVVAQCVSAWFNGPTKAGRMKCGARGVFLKPHVEDGHGERALHVGSA